MNIIIITSIAIGVIVKSVVVVRSQILCGKLCAGMLCGMLRGMLLCGSDEVITV